MNIIYEVSNATSFRDNYKELVNLDNVEIKEDNVSYGIEDSIIIGMVFVYNSIISGLTWDMIKTQISPYIISILKIKRENDSLHVRIFDGSENYDLEIPNDYNQLDLTIPNIMKLKIKK